MSSTRHPLEIREERFRLQQAIAKLEEEAPERAALEAQVTAIQESCPHDHPEEDAEKGWRCRNCDLNRPPPPQPPTEEQGESAAG